MATTATRLESDGTLLVNGEFDEFTGAPIVNGDLVFWLDATQTASYPGTGDDWFSLVDAANTAVLANGAAFASTAGGVITFDGTDDYADFSAPGLGTGTAIITVEMWANIKTTGALRMPFGFSSYDVWLNGGGLAYNTGNSDRYGISSATYSATNAIGNVAHYCFVMYNNTSLGGITYNDNKIYVNGIAQTLSQQAGTQSTSTRTFNDGAGRISSWRNNLTYVADMDVAVFKIYDRELTAEEVATNFNALAPRYDLAPIANTPAIIRTTANSVYAGEFDEVTYNLVDPEIKNLLAWSQDFTQWNANPAPNDYVVDADSATAPDGSQTADLIIKGTTAGSSSNVYKTFSGTVNTDYCGSIFVKAGGYTKVQVSFANSAFNNVSTGGLIDLAAGTIHNTVGGSTVTIESAGDGWYRISITATSDGDGGNYVFSVILLNDSYVGNFAGDGTSGIYLWGAQVELGSVATIYQPKGATTLLDTGMRERVDSDGNQYVANIFDEFTGAPVVDGNLILWLDAGQSASYAGTGNTWTDLSAAGNDSALQNSPTFDSQGWFSFNGTDQSANTGLPGATTFTTDSDFTICCWAKFSAYKAAASSIGTLVGAFNYQGYGLYWNGTPTVYTFGSYMRYEGVVSSRISSAIPLDTWYMVTQSYSRSGNFHRLYLNDTESGNTSTISGTFNSNLDTVSIGIASGAGSGGTPGGGVSGSPFLGDIAQVMIYDRALTADEVGQNFNANRRRYGI